MSICEPRLLVTIIRLDDGGQGIKSHLSVEDHVSRVGGDKIEFTYLEMSLVV